MQIAALQPETIRLFRIPLIMGNSPLFATLLKFFKKLVPVPQILTNGQGNPDRTSMTLIMFLNSHLRSKNYGIMGNSPLFATLLKFFKKLVPGRA